MNNMHSKLRVIYDSISLSIGDTKGLHKDPSALNILFGDESFEKIMNDIEYDKINGEERIVIDAWDYPKPYPNSMPCNHYPDMRNKN